VSQRSRGNPWGWLWAASVLAAGICLAGIATAKAEDGAAADQPPAAPKPMAELASQLADLEAKVADFDSQVETIRKGRLTEINTEVLRLNRETLQAKNALQQIDDRLRRGIGGKYEKLLDKAKQERDDAYQAATVKLNNYKIQYSRYSGTAEYTQYLRTAEQNYNTERENARKAYEKTRDDLKKQYNAEVDKAKKDAAGDITKNQNTISGNADKVKTLTQERADLFKKITELQRESQPLERQLNLLRRDVAERPEEAMAAGLWPRNGRYVIDADTGKLELNGGVWGKPTDSEAWRSSNQLQASGLLTLAKQQKEAGNKDMARTCLQLILDRFPDTSSAEPAKTLLADL
jgi:hypothetical protein